jgi:UDP-N-acetylmuramate dehydrogenase
LGSIAVVRLANHTTLRVGGPARRFVVAEREPDLVDALREDGPLLVLGGGSNLLVAEAGFDGTVVKIATRGIDREGDTLTVSAGEVWDDLVATCVSEGLSGVEALSGIPGLVGAVPMQNVGAYGQDVSETIVRVRTWDREAREIVVFDREACRFAYRSSVFRGKDRHVILDVTFALERSPLAKPVRYAELAKGLDVTEGTRAPLARVRDTVIALRRKKGMVLDDADPDTRSAGSFFTNPILAASEVERLPADVPKFPEADGRIKVSAAWLIERAGFAKGFTLDGRAAISSKHALALTNKTGDASSDDVVRLARAIRDGVRERFGVTLENEPVFVGTSL